MNAPAFPPHSRTLPPADGLTEAERARILAKAALFAPPPMTDADGRRELVGLSRAELEAEMVAMGEKPFRAKQLWHWIYHQGARDFAAMSTIAKPMQQRLAERFTVGRPTVATEQTSSDGTRKWLFAWRDGQQVETVYIPEEDRGAVCISTQVGCTLSCTFCHTGTQKLVRNLGAALRRMADAEGGRRAPALQHRRHGHGRAALQLRERGPGAHHHHGP